MSRSSRSAQPLGSQRGMTLVELLIAMAITAVVLVGLTGVLYDVNGYYQGWANRLDDASTGAALASALQQDSSRYIECHTTGARLTTLSLCPPGSASAAAIYTTTQTGSTFSIYRQDVASGTTILMARGVPQQPVFWSECLLGPGTISGHIHVYNYRSDARSTESFSVYFHAPIPPDGICPP